MKYAIYLFAACITLQVSCRTSKIQSDIEDEKDPEEIIANQSNVVPPSLWSVEQRRERASFYYMVGEQLSLEGDAHGAADHYSKAYNLDPNPYLGGKLIAEKMNKGERDQARLMAKKMTLLYPKVARLRLLYGIILMEKGDAKGAEKQILRAKSLDPKLAQAYVQLMRIYETQERWKKVEGLAQEWLKVDPYSQIALKALAKIYLTQKKNKDALRVAKKSYDLQPRNPEAILLYAFSLELNKNSKKAIRLYEQLFRIDPSNTELSSKLISLYHEIGGLEEALDLLNDLSARTGGKRPGVEIQRALILWEMKKTEQAANVFSSLLEEYPENDRIVYLAATAKAQLGKLSEAKSLFGRIVESSNLYIKSQFRLMMIAQGMADHSTAIDIGRHIVEQGTDMWQIYLYLSDSYSELKKFEQAANVLSDGFKKYPDRVRLLFLKGVKLEQAGKIKDSIATMRHVIKISPEYSSAYNYIGYIYAERGENLDEAEKLILKALELKKDDGYYLDSLGWVYYQKEKYKKAKDYLLRASEILPKEGVILEHLGDVFAALKNNKEAEKAYQRALKTDMKPEEKDRIKSKIIKLKG